MLAACRRASRNATRGFCSIALKCDASGQDMVVSQFRLEGIRGSFRPIFQRTHKPRCCQMPASRKYPVWTADYRGKMQRGPCPRFKPSPPTPSFNPQPQARTCPLKPRLPLRVNRAACWIVCKGQVRNLFGLAKRSSRQVANLSYARWLLRLFELY